MFCGKYKYIFCTLIYVVLSGCSSISNISKTFNEYPIVHLTNNINFIQKDEKNNNIYIKVANLTAIPNLLAESSLIEHISSNPKYKIVNSQEQANIIVDIRIMNVIPITSETLDKISKYWIYKSITDNNVINNVADLENNRTAFGIDDAGILVVSGEGKHNLKIGEHITKNKTLITHISEPDNIAGAIIGGSTAAIIGLSPAMISVGVVTGAGISNILQKLTEIETDIAIIDIVIKEKVSIVAPDTSTTKYKNISSLSKNTIEEVYIDQNFNKEVFIEHGTRLSVVSQSMTIMPKKIYKLINFSIINVVEEILR